MHTFNDINRNIIKGTKVQIAIKKNENLKIQKKEEKSE